MDFHFSLMFLLVWLAAGADQNTMELFRQQEADWLSGRRALQPANNTVLNEAGDEVAIGGAPTCNSGYTDWTNGKAHWWACGKDCEGGKYWTDVRCLCACTKPTTTTTTLPKVLPEGPRYISVEEGPCEDYNLIPITSEATCLEAARVAMDRPDLEFADNMPAGGFTTKSTGRPLGCGVHTGFGINNVEWFPEARGVCGLGSWNCICENPYVMQTVGPCEDHGLVMVTDVDECLDAARLALGMPDLPWHADMPDGGYTTTSSGRPFGCNVHSGFGINNAQFFPQATGFCGNSDSSYHWNCVCKKGASTSRQSSAFSLAALESTIYNEDTGIMPTTIYGLALVGFGTIVYRISQYTRGSKIYKEIEGQDNL